MPRCVEHGPPVLGHDVAREPVQLAVEHEARAGLEGEAAHAEDAGVVDERAAPPARVDDDLGAGPRARLERPRAEQREAAVRIVQEGRVPTQQRAVEIEVDAAQRGVTAT